eukprot:Nitzschia sp. Nitz4//scaffold16_size188269//34748//34909//NITZ4_001776-RA/size188269-exonerate_protein2genome-gene-0.135-mRNA-1//1//CDS//3329538470//4051//frame0
MQRTTSENKHKNEVHRKDAGDGWSHFASLLAIVLGAFRVAALQADESLLRILW